MDGMGESVVSCEVVLSFQDYGELQPRGSCRWK